MAFAGKPRLPSLLRPTSRPSLSDRSGTTSQGSRTMIEVTRGDILKADAEALVNTVNCVGGERWLGERLEQRGTSEGVIGVEGERATDVADRGGAQGWLGVAGRRARGDERLVRGVGG